MTVDATTLDVSGICAGYGSVPVLHDVSIKVEPGSVVTLIGANGAGKSTLLKVVGGLIQSTGGSVAFNGTDCTRRRPDQMVRAGLGIVPEGRRLFGEMTLRENLELGAYARTDRQNIAHDFERVLGLFPELRDRLSTQAKSFSGGQQQMVAIARALMGAPKLLLLDEPTIGLAPVVVDRVAALIREISELGVDILLIEQNAEVALSIADFGYVLENGRVVMADKAEALLANPQVRLAYLGV
ncbi:ATP-binding cassette domain-containing protein [Pseudooceanicola sp. 216_PA32_1]|uniref:ATP-binding cassette domain-containing protein n=1 Tax=Pseudooceanicola pacificus TaxID=2676438 RepID=A0A844W372_9RHOB|nr:ABC transporter ATP-binding protein [Pseudooceanicola pacificus]MWB77525.1 ATP-binding cassette domain-containing protein [Pseudooceanicola pacificus]